MVFKAKRDAFFTYVILGVTTMITLLFILPVLLDEASRTSFFLIIWSSTYLVIIGSILWMTFSIKYVLYEDHLFVKGGPFRSRIPYQNITSIKHTENIFVGYRVLSSRNALEVFYKHGMLGSVKISPEDEETFLIELKKRVGGED